MHTEEKILSIKKKILKHKILMNFIIDNYSTWDKIFKYTHLFLAAITPVLILIQSNLPEASNAAVVIGFVVLGLTKFKENLTYEKIRESAKEQTVKYSNIYDKIENEMIKAINKRQDPSDFIYWITRELNNIELNDPDLSNKSKNEFLKFCKINEIEYSDDIIDLNRLNHLDKNTEKTIELNHLDKTSEKTNEEKTIEEKINEEKTTDKTNEKKTTDKTIEEKTNKPDLSINIQESHTPRTKKSMDKTKYKETVKNIDVKSDLKWTLERMKHI